MGWEMSFYGEIVVSNPPKITKQQVLGLKGVMKEQLVELIY